ncbi:MAG: OmpA family protein [Saprospiraceae bacterium]
MKYLLPFFMFLAPALNAQSLFDSLLTRYDFRVYFETSESQITEEAALVLDSLVAGIDSTKGLIRIQVTAHTDSIGSGRSNLLLSSRRATKVKEALVERGLHPMQITIQGFGERDPHASNETEEGRQENRCAVITVRIERPMVTLKGTIRNPKTQQGIPNALVLFASKGKQDSVRTDSNGVYFARLPANTTVRVDAYARDYFFETLMLELYGDKILTDKYHLDKDLELQPIEIGERYIIQNLFFQPGLAYLLPVCEPTLPKVLRFMRINPDIKIEIAGHIHSWDKDPNEFYPHGYRLSRNRALLVYEYLLRYGIEKERMTFEGYSNTQMLYPPGKASELEISQNRRVEVWVVSKTVYEEKK